MQTLLTVPQLAKHFSVHSETVRLWARKGKVPFLRPSERTIRFNLADVEKALAHPMRTNTKAQPKCQPTSPQRIITLREQIKDVRGNLATMSVQDLGRVLQPLIVRIQAIEGEIEGDYHFKVTNPRARRHLKKMDIAEARRVVDEELDHILKQLVELADKYRSG